MDTYKNAHKWLLIPFAIAIIGFLPSYYLQFANAKFGHHIHGLSATFWYAIVIYQPYLIRKKEIQKHKKYGVLGVFLAGMVVASGLAMIPGNISGAMAQEASGQLSQIAPPFFLYGVSLFDFVAIAGFGVSVIIAIKKSRNVDDHALWMISTVFWALMPALARMALIPLVFLDNITHFANMAMLTTPLIILSLVVVMFRVKKAHPALIAAGIANLLSFVIIPLGKADWWISFVQTFFKS
ncbi:hypothetical protein [Ekhidna sp.]|uniref:hypothetical protein n=1 Tax=Ekhidna sp. TaxID=2608089 RepID=UPI003C7CCF9C